MRTLNAIYMVVVMIVLNVVLASCKDGNENDFVPAPVAPTNNNTPKDSTETPKPTDNSAWSTVYGGDAQMNNEGFVRRYLLIARQDAKSDSVVSNYQVIMNVPDTTRISYMGTELLNPVNGIIPTQQSLYPTGNESYTEGADHVLRANEATAHDIYCGATMINVSIERQLAKVIVKGKPYSFEFADYSFNATKESFRVVIDTVENKIYRYDILDGVAHMKQGTGDYAKSFVVIMSRYIGEVESSDETPKSNPMPGCLVISGKAKFYGTITPVMASGKLQGYDNIVTAVTNDSIYAIHAATSTVVAKGSRANYPLSSDAVTCSYTAVKVNGSWKIAYVQKNQTGEAYVYRWGDSSTEYYTIPLGEFVTGGAKNLDEKGNAKQNPFLRLVVSEPNSYDNGFTYQVQAYNYTKMVANLLVGYFK